VGGARCGQYSPIVREYELSDVRRSLSKTKAEALLCPGLSDYCCAPTPPVQPAARAAASSALVLGRLLLLLEGLLQQTHNLLLTHLLCARDEACVAGDLNVLDLELRGGDRAVAQRTFLGLLGGHLASVARP
jgi:hypothetical protein